MSVGDRPRMDIADRVDVEVLLRRFYAFSPMAFSPIRLPNYGCMGSIRIFL
jgi:hypothetical protein